MRYKFLTIGFGRTLRGLTAAFGLLALVVGLAWGQSAPTVAVSAGFNLLGNSSSSTIDVAGAFGDSSRFLSVWKWNAASSKWAFYTPLQTDAGRAYCQSKGYEPLTAINAGEGFWLNARQEGTLAFLGDTPVTSASFQNALPDGFSLIATGDAYTPVQFNAALSATPPSPGSVTQTITSLWTWDPIRANWYFYAPSLDQAGTLASYIQSKNYLDFAALGKTLGAGVGFWVNLGTNASVSTPPPSIASGVITGFHGGLMVNGRAYPDGRAGYDKMGDHPDADAMSAEGMQLGHEVMLEFDAGGNAIAVHVFPGLIGPVEAIPPTTPANQITVAGVTVRINADPNAGTVTVFGGYTSLADIKVGDRVEVHGVRQTDAQGLSYLAATRIELRPSLCSPTPCPVRVSGNISQMDAAAKTLLLDGLTVQYGSAQILPAGIQLAVGQWVSVLSNASPVAGVLVASALKVRRASTTATTLSVAGAVGNFVSAANFVVRGITVDASASNLAPANQHLGNGQQVSIQGNFDPATNLLVASSLSVMQPLAGSTEVEGSIADFVSQANFTVRNGVVDATNAVFVGGTAADLQNNAFVEVHGALSGGVLVATTVAFRGLPQGVMETYPGQVANYLASTGSFDLILPNGSVLPAVLAHPDFRGGSLANLANGAYVRVTGLLSNGVLAARSIQFMLASPGMMMHGGARPMELGGIARNVLSLGNSLSFTLNGISVVYMGSVPGFSNGMRVEVLGSMAGPGFIASQVTLNN
ncbi:MAG: DUF5666 domain-containing protein [Rhodocyclaceae bacterium]|nr:DUF5666 domain-containing protein [Rhodocyclaceae bacterium]